MTPSEQENMLKNMLYNIVKGIVTDSKLYYHSTTSSDFSRLTALGEDSIKQCVIMMAPKIIANEKCILDQAIKNSIWDTVKE